MSNFSGSAKMRSSWLAEKSTICMREPAGTLTPCSSTSKVFWRGWPPIEEEWRSVSWNAASHNGSLLSTASIWSGCCNSRYHIFKMAPRVVSPPPPTMSAMLEVISSVESTSPSTTVLHSSEMMSGATSLPSSSSKKFGFKRRSSTMLSTKSSRSWRAIRPFCS